MSIPECGVPCSATAEIINDPLNLLDDLIRDSLLYKNSKNYKELLDFVVKFRNVSPFNAMLLQIQKPGLTFAATLHDWQVRYRRYINEGARPLVILWPFGPVAFVYDVADTDGEPLPEDILEPFRATGPITTDRLQSITRRLIRKRITTKFIEYGTGAAGSIRAISSPPDTSYQVNINSTHTPDNQFATLVHELGHLFLGHLGYDKKLKIKDRQRIQKATRELEAESVSYLVCNRNGVETNSAAYLSCIVDKNIISQLDTNIVLTAAGKVEACL